jgi:hypothetical protein
MRFDPSILAPDDWSVYARLTYGRDPDVVLAPDGDPYLYRWHLVYDNSAANVFFHVQVKSDPERPLHDHPWDNHSVILSGGYDEMYWPYSAKSESRVQVELPEPMWRVCRKGDAVSRKASWAHRLILPPGVPYTMTLFTTGPKVREWGFWYPDGWHHNKRHVDDRMVNGRGVSIGAH